MNRLDHLVLASQTLQEGVEYVQGVLQVELSLAGGQHPQMGTHNRLLNMGQGAYLEVIATDPEAPSPPHPRWFELDRFVGTPRLLTWVARSEMLERYAALELGQIRQIRRGDLEWKMLIPADGRLHWGGVVPYLIQWGSQHPSDSLPDMGCRLEELLLCHPEPPAVDKVLRSLELDLSRVRLLQAESPGLQALVQTPVGPRLLL